MATVGVAGIGVTVAEGGGVNVTVGRNVDVAGSEVTVGEAVTGVAEATVGVGETGVNVGMVAVGETGVLVPYGEPQAFIDAAVQLVRTPQSLRTIRQHARAYATSVDWQCVVERFVTLLTGALDASHHTPASALTS